LVAHSNGPLYAQYFLTHMSQKWKSTYIHGFTPIAGNWAGQGLLYPVFFTGLNIIDFSFPTTIENAISSARMYLSHPSSYMSAADPAVFHDDEVVVTTADGASYTPLNYNTLFRDAGLPTAQTLATYYIGFVKFAPSNFPNVDVYAEKGSGIETAVGAGLQDLTVGQLLSDPPIFYTRDGDVNQEDITNDAVSVWAGMPCFHFELTDNPGVDHFSLPSDTAVLERLLTHLQRPRSVCR
jgi:lecithin-cholesterol acyltransferase